MPEYAPGTPMWVDVSSPDLEKSRTFYGGLFGWDAQVAPEPEAGGYTVFTLDGKMVAGGGPTFSADAHPAWSTYVHATDADATAKAAADAGGQVAYEPMDVMGQGRMAILRDPTGAFVSIWQPQLHTGAELVNETGGFCWNELYTRDLPAAREFYQKVFGWTAEDVDYSGSKYTMFQVGGKGVAGGMDMTSMLPESIPPHWLVYFTVDDTAASVAKAKELGAQILKEPMDTPMGPIAVIQDPVGAVFSIIQIKHES